MSTKILLLPGDGIGPEVMAQARRILEWLAQNRSFEMELDEALVGGAAYDQEGVAISDTTIKKAHAADAVMLGAVGGPKWADVAYEHRPEAGLLALRKQLDLFANLRPALCFPALADASSLKRDLVEGLDILIVRELTGGVYFGEPRGVKDIGGGKKQGINTHLYDSDEIQRIARVAFDFAQQRSKRITSVEKRNVMEAGQLWYEEVIKLHAQNYSDIALDHMLADNCAMQLVRQPKQFDVILTDNLFGDILSDIAAQLTGSLGMLPSASLGAPDAKGRRPALYEPVHGAAPDIAGQNKANPLAMILSVAMALRYSFDRPNDATRLEQAVSEVLARGHRTADISSDGTALSTPDMGSAVLEVLAQQV